MATLNDLTETLGTSVLRVVTQPAAGGPIHEVVIYDRGDALDVRAGDVVLGVGIGSTDQAAEALDELDEVGVAALVLKPSIVPDDLTPSRTAVLTIPERASWYQIVLLIHSVVSPGGEGGDGSRGVAAGGLFALADSVASLIGAPVTVEDPSSRVIAYSVGQDRADVGRRETIVGRRVPERWVARLEELGVFKRLRAESEPIYVDGINEKILPRLTIAIRAGDELLGSVWAVVREPPTVQQNDALREAAKIAALYLLRQRAESDVERRLHAELSASLLHGGAGAKEAAQRLGLTSGPYRVLALSVPEGEVGDEERVRDELWQLLLVHAHAFRVRSAISLVGGVLYCVLSTEADASVAAARIRQFAEELHARASAGRHAPPMVGIGGRADELGDVPRSRREADEALRVVRSSTLDPPVAAIEEVRPRALLRRFAEVAGEERDIYEGKVRALIRSDAEANTSYIETLRAYFDSFGDYNAAGRLLHVHPNTLRYRIRKLQEISGIKLDDPEERLALMMLVQVLLDPGR